MGDFQIPTFEMWGDTLLKWILVGFRQFSRLNKNCRPHLDLKEIRLSIFHYVLTFSNTENSSCTRNVVSRKTSESSTNTLPRQNSRLTTHDSRPLFLTDFFPFPFSCRAGSWPVSWWSTATRARSWAGRNLWRRKQLRRLLSLQSATLSTTGADQRELTSHQLTTFTGVSSAWLTGGDTFTTTISQMLDLSKGLLCS